MALQFKTEPQEGYLKLSVSGRYETGAFYAMIQPILEACREFKAAKVLLDGRGLMGNMPDMDRFHFADSFATRYFEEKKAGRISHIRFAFLGFHPIVDPNKFGETVAVNRGITVKVTTDPKEAMDWLLVESSRE